VTYNGNGNGSGTVPIDNTAYAAGATVTVLGNTGNLFRFSFAFDGWNTAADGSGTTYQGGATFTMGSGNVTLYAKWKVFVIPIPLIVMYDGNGNTGGSVPIDSNGYATGATVTVLGNTGSLVKSGYAFTGWNTSANGSGTGYVGGSTFAIGSADVTLYAQWTPVSTTGCVWAPQGMVAWWPLDETSGTAVADIAGSFDGTAQPAAIGTPSGPGPASSAFWPPTPAFPFPAGTVGTSLDFANGPHVEVPSNPALEPGSGDFTIDAWVIYAARGTGNYLLIARKLSTGFVGYQMDIQDVSTTLGTLRFLVGGPSVTPVLTANITPLTWHHVAGTLQRGTAQTMVLYLDGAVVASGPVGSGGSASNTQSLLIGGDGASKGEIAVDEVELFNRALSQPEVNSLFNAGARGKCKCVAPPAGMVSWWPGDGNANDIVGSNNGVLQGTIVFTAGEVDQAFGIPATSDYVEVANAANLNFGSPKPAGSGGDLSIDAWIETRSSIRGTCPGALSAIRCFSTTVTWRFNCRTEISSTTSAPRACPTYATATSITWP